MAIVEAAGIAGGDDARVHAALGPVAVVPTKADVEALIAKRDDVGPRVVYLSSTCPLRLSWMH